MKFLLSNELKQSKIKNLLLCYLAGLFLFCLSSVYYEFYKVGLTPSQLKTKLQGNLEQFITALPFEELVLFTHIKLFMFLVFALVLIALFFRTKASEALKSKVSIYIFSLILIDCLLPMAIFYNMTWAAYIKPLSFLTLESIFLLLTCYNIKYLVKSSS